MKIFCINCFVIPLHVFPECYQSRIITQGEKFEEDSAHELARSESVCVCVCVCNK